MKVVKQNTACEICGEDFEGDFIQHEKPEDDFPWEGQPTMFKTYDDDGSEIIEYEGAPEEITYPHIHEQPTVECHVCLECRKELGAKKDAD